MEAAAPTAERLMRSRFSAFALGLPRYLLDSWHPSTRPDTLDLDAGLRWQLLDILRTERGGPFDTDGVVEFRATYREGGHRGELRETSTFTRDGTRWFYVDGVIH
jgi:SEC-C motif-containing protein